MKKQLTPHTPKPQPAWRIEQERAKLREVLRRIAEDRSFAFDELRQAATELDRLGAL